MGNETSESVVWLSLERKAWPRSCANGNAKTLAQFVVPSNLTTSSPNPEKSKGNAVTVDFDDKLFAERLRAWYCKLSGSWVRRVFSARKLNRRQLGQVNTWSTPSSTVTLSSTSKLLVASTGLREDADTKSPFTDDSLMKLYNNPKDGKARYTWVHWARRVAASNVPQRRRRSSHHLSVQSHQHQSNDLVISGEKDDAPATAQPLPDMITTIQFAHSLSMIRILSVLTVMLALSISAALCWVFLGSNTSVARPLNVSVQRTDRVGSGMAIGILVLLLESVGFGAWVWLS